MKLIIACLRIQRLCRRLGTETDETKRRVLARLASGYCRRLAKSLGDEEELRNLAVIEIGHRLKNKIATIQSIIAYQLRDHEATRDVILQRLGALSSADMLIEAAHGQGAFIKDIINTELAPYDMSRATVEGPQIFFDAKLALVLVLIFHELATNAAKYGALSCPSGHVSLFWSVSGSKLMLEWRESGGPTVSIPTHKGFGTRLLSNALGQFGGTVNTNFATTGLICTMSLTFLPKNSISPPAAPSQLQTPTVNTLSSKNDLPREAPVVACLTTFFKTTAI